MKPSGFWKNSKIINFSSPEVEKTLLSNLHSVIEIRDKFAHGDIIFSGKMPQLYFTYNSEKQHVNLDNLYFENLNALFGQTLAVLDELHKALAPAR